MATMPGTVQKLAEGDDVNKLPVSVKPPKPFGYASANDIWRMSDADRTSYWTNLDKHAAENDYQGEDFTKYRAGLAPELRADYDSTHLNLTGAPAGTPGYGYYLGSPAERLKHIQQEEAKTFRTDLPKVQTQMVENAKTQTNQSLSAANRNTRQNMSTRGLLHSGLAAGALESNRAKAQSGIAQATADINSGLINAADTLDSQAIESGLNIQQAQQTLQNQVYSQAMARMNAQNQMICSGLGFLTTGALAAAGGRK